MLQWLIHVRKGSSRYWLSRCAADTYRSRAQYQAELVQIFLPVVVTIAVGGSVTLFYTMSLCGAVHRHFAGTLAARRQETFTMPNNPFASILAGRRFTAEESAELAAQVAQLARSGLPLEAGLRALSEELPAGRLTQVLRHVANQLEAGQPIDAALDSQKSRLPAHLRGLIVAGVRTGRLAEVLEEYVDLQRTHREIWRRVWLASPIRFAFG